MCYKFDPVFEKQLEEKAKCLKATIHVMGVIYMSLNITGISLIWYDTALCHCT